MKKNGISLIVLIITIIVVSIIASAIILSLTNTGVIDQSKKARFMSDFTNVQEGVNLYSFSKFNASTGQFELPLKGYLTAGDKTYITNSVPTLNTKIEELSGSIDTANLAWISSENININLSREKREKGYIIDVNNGQIYDYIGDVFENKRWHTLDGGVAITGDTEVSIVTQELWNGWINLTLYYPAGSTEKKWRLGTEGELRVEPMLMWQNYTGPISIPLDRIQDVWIKYIIDNNEVTVPPAGTLLVDIVPDKTGYTKVPAVSVKINYDDSATLKEYRVGESSWITYNGQFNVTENCIIEARGKKTESVYSTTGSLIATRDVAGRDLVYIGNIGAQETDLVAPTITRLPGVDPEKARVQIVYPIGADKQVYKINYGLEENYTSEIAINNYGTYIIAYYYDASGKRSKSAAIRINDTTSGATAELPIIYELQPPYVPGDPLPQYTLGTYGINIPAPTVNVNPTTLVDAVQVSINAPANANKVYIKLGRYAEYEEYKSAITVRQNMEVYSYYRTFTGEKSDIGYGAVKNIKQYNKPYVHIDANPYPWSGSYGESEVTVTINYSDTTVIEYSEDGIVYKPYTAAFIVSENKTIYARGSNAFGITETSLNITNIGKLTAPTPINNLSVSINVNPEPLTSIDKVTKTNVTIDYDTKATQKYYSIGRFGTLQTYTGGFEVTSNSTIYAYAKGVNAQGETSKTIDNLLTGIAEPSITATPLNNEQASEVTVSINFDKYASIKRYSINAATLREYTAPFDISKNGSTIYAYSQNELGYSSEASYTIENIVPKPPVLVIDKGQYYLLKLNYPVTSKNREYKWKTNGEWKGYKEAGILLLKPQYKDQLLQNGVLVQIEDETGNLVTFTGDYYFIDVPINELFENLFMRWDRESLNSPQIVITPSEPAIKVNASIVYNTALITKQYKVIKPGETTGTWMDYTGPITIEENNTVIYARGMDETEVWTAESIKKITNIDENHPVIKLTADLDVAQQKVAVKVSVTDDVEVGKIKWSAGIQGESYFINSGTEILNNSIVNITSNGYYTFYGEDKVGNKQVYTLNVTNVDLTPPTIDITVDLEITVSLTANVTINYGDATTKQYKVGTSNTVWTNYTATFAISSYTILANNWQNADGTVTIYAKGIDSSGNEITVQKKVVSLDLDKPNLPIINTNSGYPILTDYGIIYDSTTTITFDTRTDINNYYSIDNGVTWLTYAGKFNMSSGTIIAKSIKKATGLEVVTSKTITIPSDALKIQSYDGNDSTYTTGSYSPKYINVDPSLQGKKIRVLWIDETIHNDNNIIFLDVNNNEISRIVSPTNLKTDGVYTIPINTKRINIMTSNATNATSFFNFFEIQPSNEPTFGITKGYMLLHLDAAKIIRSPYQMISISYFATSVQRLYRIGTTGNWLDYNDQPIKVNQGQTIYAKGIDQYGRETRIVSSHTVNVTDALGSQAFDGNDTTYVPGSISNKYIDIDPSMQGRIIRVLWSDTTVNNENYLIFLDINNNEISRIISPTNVTTDAKYTIPSNATRINIIAASTYYVSTTLDFYEIQVSNEPTFSATNGYMLLHADLSKAIRTPYKMVRITYNITSVQRLYRIGTTGNWLNYNDQPIKVNQGQTLYAKGVDQYGNETRIASSYTVNVTDALQSASYDGNNSTYTTGSFSNKYIDVDPSVQGKSIRVVWYDGTSHNENNLIFLDINNNEISRIKSPNGATTNTTYMVPINTTRINIITSGSSYATTHFHFYEIGFNN